MEPIVHVAVTGASGQIAYSLLFRLASGEVFGQRRIALHLLELPAMVNAMAGVRMELEDCAFPLVSEIICGSDPMEVFAGVEWAFLVGAKPRGPGMERKDLLMENGKIFQVQGRALNTVASKDVRVLVVGNPCNTNALIALHNAPDLPAEHFFAMTRLDQNRARAFLAQKANVPVTDVKNMIIWGNHSNTQVPDFTNARIQDKPLQQVITDTPWLEGEFFKKVQNRGAEIIQARGKSSAASAASAALDTVKSLLSPSKEPFSMAVYSNKNSYGINNDLVFSFPLRFKAIGEWEEVAGVPWDSFIEAKIRQTEKELLEERDAVKDILKV